MLALTDLKTGTRLIAAMMIKALIIMLVAAVGYLSIQSVSAAVDSIYADRLLPAQWLGSVNDAQLRIQADCRTFILEPEERDKIEQDIVLQVGRVDKDIKEYEVTYLVPEEVRGLAEFRSAWADLKRTVADALREAKSGNEHAAQQSVREGGAVFVAHERADRIVGELILIQVREGAGLKQRTERTLYQVTWAMILAGVLGVFLAVALGLFVSRTITIPLSRITRAAGAVAQTGVPSTALVEIASRDEIGFLAKAFNAMTARIGELVGGLEERNQQ